MAGNSISPILVLGGAALGAFYLGLDGMVYGAFIATIVGAMGIK